MSALLELNTVSLAYQTPKGLRAVAENLSLSLEHGEIACLLGASGCGKTSILRAIAGFEPLRSGSICLNGKTISSVTSSLPPEKRQIGMMFQDYALFPHLTAYQNIAFGLRRLSRDKQAQQVSKMLEMVGLQTLSDAYPHELSGGQQQRIALARALAPEPELLLLDEPFSNLDSHLREHLAQELRDILKAGQHSALMVTHDYAEAVTTADEIYVMEDGKIVQWDSAHPPSSFQPRPETDR